MREKCPCCKQILSKSKSKWLETSLTSLPIPATTNEEIVNLKQPKNSTSFETLVMVPLAQSGIYGAFIAITVGWAYSSIMEINPIAPILSIGFFASGLAWAWHSHFFNSLLKPLVEVGEKPKEDNNNQKPIVLEISDEKTKTITRGSISSDIATTEEIIEFAEIVKRELSIEHWASEKVSLAQIKFTRKPNKIFSQPRWAKFIQYLESRELVRRVNEGAKNSTYILTQKGINFILKYSELEL